MTHTSTTPSYCIAKKSKQTIFYKKFDFNAKSSDLEKRLFSSAIDLLIQ